MKPISDEAYQRRTAQIIRERLGTIDVRLRDNESSNLRRERAALIAILKEV